MMTAPIIMQPAEILATYIHIQCKRNQAKPNINTNLDPMFIQNTQNQYQDMKILITKLCDKFRLQKKQIFQTIRLLEKYCKNKEVSLVFNNYYRLLITAVNILNKFYNDKYLWLNSVSQLTQIPIDILQTAEIHFSVSIDFDLYYADQLYESDVGKIEIFIEKYFPKYCK